MMRMVFLAALLLALALRAGEPDPLWDGRESVATYAQRAHLDAEKTVDLGNGVKLEVVLIPAGRFIMGTAEPAKPEITVLSGQVLIGIGAVLSLGLLVFLLFRKRKGQRLSFSLRWLLAFSVLCGLMVWGGTRWYRALVQNREYAAAMERYDAAIAHEKPAHPVLISKAFYMGKYAVTQEQYEAMIGQNPSHFKGAHLPVETVSWNEASAFCKKLNERLQALGMETRLPTEAQWEYACRAGTTTNYYSGDAESDLDGVAWYRANSGKKTHPVGGKKANAFGLYDMTGNVWQWCKDLYREDYEKLNSADPIYDAVGAQRVIRGGSWHNDPWNCRSSMRARNAAKLAAFYYGFRVVVSEVTLDSRAGGNGNVCAVA